MIKYIVWTTTNQETIEFRELLKPHSNIITPINNVISCIETKLDANEIRECVGGEMEMVCLEADEKFIRNLLSKSPLLDERKNFMKFLSVTRAPTSINEILDLINERGGIEFLTERELNALNKLSNHTN